MAPYAKVAVFSVLMLSLVGAAVSAHAPKDEIVDPLVRPLYLVYAEDTSARDDPYNYSASSRHEMGDNGYRLSLTNNTTAASRGYQFSEQPGGIVCTQWYNSCMTVARGKAAHAGDDIMIEPQPSYHGQVRVAWALHSPMTLMGSQIVGDIQFGLKVGEEEYHAHSVPLRASRGEAVFPLSFERMERYDETCVEEAYHNGSHEHDHCAIPFNGTADVWAHDVSLGFTVHFHRDSLGRPLGSSFEVKIDTAGGSLVEVKERVPPPPPVAAEEPLEAGSEDVAVEAVHEDKDGDGQVDADELHFVPGLPVPALVAGLGLLALGLRRLRR